MGAKNHHVRNIRAVALNRLLPPPLVCMPSPSYLTSTSELKHRSRLSLISAHDSFTSLVHDSCRRQYEDFCACPCLWHKNVERREDCTATSVSNPPCMRACVVVKLYRPEHRSDLQQAADTSSPPGSPDRWRARRLSHSTYYTRPLRRYTRLDCRIILALIVIALYVFFTLWQPHVEFSIYSRRWIRNEVETMQPLSGCFNENRVSHKYNVTQALYGAKKNEIHAGMPMRLGMDCYNFAGTIKSSYEIPPKWIPPAERVQYHTYWRSDLAVFGERQEWMIKSFFATQNTETSRLVLWSNGDLSHNKIVQKWVRRYPDAFTLKLVDLDKLARGTELQGSKLLELKDKKAWIDGDMIRLLVLWAYGGVWVDMDSLLTRDLAPLLEHEFVTQWDCYGESHAALAFSLLGHSCPCDRLQTKFIFHSTELS